MSFAGFTSRIRARGICSAKTPYYNPYFSLYFSEFLFASWFVLFCWGSGVQVRFTFSAYCFQVSDDANVHTLGVDQYRPSHPAAIQVECSGLS